MQVFYQKNNSFFLFFVLRQNFGLDTYGIICMNLFGKTIKDV